jgi:hypothetical protein
MNDLRAAARQALEALERNVQHKYPLETTKAIQLGQEAITALRAALAQQQEQEPVAWKDRTYGNLHHQDFGNSIPLYTHPPRREWVSLTEEEIDAVLFPYCDNKYEWIDYREVARAIEAALKERNT